jgi:hypothetical protein
LTRKRRKARAKRRRFDNKVEARALMAGEKNKETPEMRIRFSIPSLKFQNQPPDN